MIYNSNQAIGGLGYRQLQNRKHRNRVRGFRQYRKRDLFYTLIFFFTLGTFVNSFFHVKYIKVNVPTPAYASNDSLGAFMVKDYKTVKATPTPLLKDDREKRLHEFLVQVGSPLAEEAHTFIAVADKYGLDYTLMPAISHKESSYGNALPAGSFNPFGLGGKKFMHFDSWASAIWFEGKLLSDNYRAESNYAIGYKYCPPSECAPDWAEVVTETQLAIINK